MEQSTVDLSICIVSYGNDVGTLIAALHEEIEANDSLSSSEILISDQFASSHPLKEEWIQYPRVTYHNFTAQQGRSANRNHLIKISRGKQLLFLDADALPVPSNFIANYLEHVAANKVVVGGTAYHKEHKQWLRYKVGIVKESISSQRRNLNPYSSFSAFNVCMDRNIAMNIQFDEELLEYGHEDTLFGLELRHRCIPVVHVDNPAYHMGIDADNEFMEKTKTAVLGLAVLINAGKIDEDVRLYAVYRKLQSWGGAMFLRLLYPSIGPRIFRQLCNGRGSVKSFDFYKLLLLCAARPTIGRKTS
jgi:glycosyltransferase involved in cell wall biosynthesis